MLDPRLHPFRADLAAAHLRGQVEAARFVEGRPAAIAVPRVALQRRPEPSAPWETEALYGESVVVYEQNGDWAWVQLDRDGYVGYLAAVALGAAEAPTHRVAALRTHAYPGASIKLPHLFALPLGARLRITEQAGDFLVDGAGRRYWARHLAPVDSVEPDFVAVAERFLHVPYLWGGRTSEGIDCSGLTQTALTAAGRAAPRDSDMLEMLGDALPADAPLQRGDLVFWKGHVGVMRDADTLLHANGHHMAVVTESLEEARLRTVANGGGAITSIRRL
jgi:cell wall-associated NlpC family hydrolase